MPDKMPEEIEDGACALSGRLSAFFDGEVSPEEGREIQSHLEECASCADRFEAIRSVSRTLQGTWSPAARRDLGNRIRQALVRRPGDAILHLAEGLMAAAAAVLCASLIYIFAESPGSQATGRYELSLAAISLEMSQPAPADRPEDEQLANYILADLSAEAVE